MKSASDICELRRRTPNSNFETTRILSVFFTDHFYFFLFELCNSTFSEETKKKISDFTRYFENQAFDDLQKFDSAVVAAGAV